MDLTKTNTLKSNEALSSGLIFNIKGKDKEREFIRKRTEDYLKRGNKIHAY